MLLKGGTGLGKVQALVRFVGLGRLLTGSIIVLWEPGVKH